MIREVILFMCLVTVHGYNFCSTNNSIAAFKRPTYEFSLNILYRVAEQEDYHFAYSPISTWLQLVSLALGARGETSSELQNVTRYIKNKCFQRKYFQENHRLRKNLVALTEKSSFVVVHKLVGVKRKYINLINTCRISKVLPVNFDEPERAATLTNGLIERNTRGVIKQGVYVDDFENKLLFLTDNGYFKSNWLHPFDPLFTSEETFYSERNEDVGKVRMMSQLNYFRIAKIPKINAEVLELPFNTRRKMSMLIALPIDGAIGDLLYAFKGVTLRTIFNLNRRRKELVLVKLPRFRIDTELSNLAELLNDMGLQKIFYPELSDFGGISNTKLFVSLIAQQTRVEVTEEGARAMYNSPDFLVKGNQTRKFEANRPFAFFIVDKVTEIILFAGMYSNAAVY
ncbi:serine protease inhibitor 77Ba-like [Aricia agestis]|uniref:serine protease inhibitor 77Ba-like n=1 Tax=Aricia agestis TaxID=91739 RepID=UPI001C207D9B|nr:serine protease inhibitor 77Ba-like [Aricia agestis]